MRGSKRSSKGPLPWLIIGSVATVAIWKGCGRASSGTDVVKSSEAKPSSKSLTADNMNENLKAMEYAVRGAVPQRAEEIAAEMAAAAEAGLPNPYNFSSLLRCNIGNPQSVGQKPVTFYRQVLALVDSPDLLQAAKRGRLLFYYPKDVIQRAEELANGFEGGTGAYSHSQGAALIRQHVCEFIEARDDGPQCNPDDIYLVNGASAGIQTILTALISSPQDAVLIPIPQYPIYSALITLLGGVQVGYNLDEEADWGLSVEELKRSVYEARAQGSNPRALVLINPGNPTGQVLSAEALEDVIRFCKEERLVLLADEVYQENVYAQGVDFVSARKVRASMGPEFADTELVSFHSTSKGLIGECGRRGGYMELVGIDPEVASHIYKLQSSQLCPNSDGQVTVDLMVRPPSPRDPSYKKFQKETGGIYGTLQRKSEMVSNRLNSIKGLSCKSATGAMYVFAKLDLPQRAIDLAASRGMAPDLMYCLSLLEATGIVTVPGSGFGQKEGEWHFRMTFLPEEEELPAALDRLEAHHHDFMARYSSE